MSERRERQDLASVLEECLLQIRFEQKQQNAKEAALVKALQVLDATPRHLVHATMTREYAPRGLATIEAVRCSECCLNADDPILGWTKEWKYCPKCGALVDSTQQEESPTKRLTEAAISRAALHISRA